MQKQSKKLNKLFLIMGTSITGVICIIICICLILFHQLIPLLPIAPDIIGMHGEKTYLILFQNNAELRPGGGFIGSYALVSFSKGHMGQLTIHNTYDADGLLHKHIEPYFIGRRYLQVHLYMRDSNFDVDFVKNAQKVAYMLKEETGKQVDGVIAIDLSFVRSLLGVISPVYIWQYNINVTPSNFFLLTEQHSDKNSFYGSTQKQDFLSALFESIQTKIEVNKYADYLAFFQKTMDAITQKHLLFVLLDQKQQEILSDNGFSSALIDIRPKTYGVINDFMGINEANIGANKANYFLKRSIAQRTIIEPSGTILGSITLTYTNTTKEDKWPSGVYKNYLRIILPLHTKLASIAIDRKKQTLVPAITTFRQYEAPDFIPPQGLEVDTAEENGKTMYGFIVTIGLHATKTVTINYALPDKFPINKSLSTYNLLLFKQPGMDNDPYSFLLTYPKQYTISTSGTIKQILIQPCSLLFLTNFATDNTIGVQLSK